MYELLTVGEVARILRVDNTTVRRWVKQGSLEAVELPCKEGGRQGYRIKQETVDTMMKGTRRRTA
jgi:excisionase family DNA binding protein